MTDPQVSSFFARMNQVRRRDTGVTGYPDGNGGYLSPLTNIARPHIWVSLSGNRGIVRAINGFGVDDSLAGVPVELELNRAGEWSVIGLDSAEAPRVLGAGTLAATVPTISPTYNTSVITARNILPGGLFADSDQGGLYVRIGAYWHSGGFWSGENSYAVTPTSTSAKKSLILVGIDRATNDYKATLTTDRSPTTALMVNGQLTTIARDDIKAVIDADTDTDWRGYIEIANGETAVNSQLIGQIGAWLHPVMVGADGADAGIAGLVPAPAAADDAKYLRGDGTWVAPTANIDITALTETTTIDGAADFLVVYDASATANRKVKPNNLPGGGGTGDYMLFTHEEAANTDGGTATSGSRQTRKLNYKRDDSGTHGSIIELAFTSGGTYEVVAGDTITGATSGATATVFDVVLTSGTWAGGDAAGTLWLNDQTGTFQSENLNVGASTNVATIAGNSTSANYRFRLEAGTYRLTGDFQFYDTGGVQMWLYNVTDSADELYSHSGYTSSAGTAAIALPMRGRFTIAANKTFRFEYQCGVTSSTTDGQGIKNNLAATEKYATVELIRE